MYKKLTIITIIFLFLDQISKLLVNYFVDLNQSVTVIPNFFSIEYVHNYGAAFSIFIGQKYFFIIMGILSIYLIIKYFIKDLNKFNIFVYSLLLSGIIGNMLDRIIYGYVRDFLSFNLFGYNFAIFNLADVFIVVSVLVILIWGKVWKNI